MTHRIAIVDTNCRERFGDIAADPSDDHYIVTNADQRHQSNHSGGCIRVILFIVSRL